MEVGWPVPTSRHAEARERVEQILRTYGLLSDFFSVLAIASIYDPPSGRGRNRVSTMLRLRSIKSESDCINPLYDVALLDTVRAGSLTPLPRSSGLLTADKALASTWAGINNVPLGLAPQGPGSLYRPTRSFFPAASDEEYALVLELLYSQC